MKVLHTACLLNAAPGMVNQMVWEQEAANELSLLWDVVLFSRDNIHSSVSHLTGITGKTIFSYVLLRIKFAFWLVKAQNKYDLILLRYSLHDPFQWLTSFFLHNYLTVHHTFEQEEIRLKKGVMGKIKSAIEEFCAIGTLNRALGIIGVTAEIAEHQLKRCRISKPTFEYVNGIKCQGYIFDRRDIKVELLFVASIFSPWIGLDLLFDELDKNSFEHIIIHLVGELPNELLIRAGNYDNIIIHGMLPLKQIYKLAEQSWLGITSFGFFRKNMKTACTLKARDYLCKGLPVVGGYEEAGLPNGFPYYRKMKCDINEIVSYAKEMKLIKKTDVYEISMQHIGKSRILNNLFKQLKRSSSNEDFKF
jgi:hypothetical protein